MTCYIYFLLIKAVVFLLLKKKKKKKEGSSHCGSAETNLTSTHKDEGSIPGLDQWVKDPALPWAVVEVTEQLRSGVAVAEA